MAVGAGTGGAETAFMNPAEFANIAQCEEHLWWYRGMRYIVCRMLEPYVAGRRISRVLEAGCGTGYFSHFLHREYGWPMVSLDISAEGLRYARSIGAEQPIQGDVRDLPFADGSFDLAISMDVLAHVPRGEEQRAASELVRVLAPDGLLVVRTAAFDWLRSRHSQLVSERQRFTRRRLTELFRAAGLAPDRVTYANSLLLPVAVAKFRVWEPLLNKAAASGIEPLPPWLDRVLYRLLSLEAAWLGGGHNLPVGQTLVLLARKARA